MKLWTVKKNRTVKTRLNSRNGKRPRNKISVWAPRRPGHNTNKRKKMYYILEDYNGHFYTEGMANGEFSSLQAAEKKLQALKELKPKGKYFIVTRVQA